MCPAIQHLFRFLLSEVMEVYGSCFEVDSSERVDRKMRGKHKLVANYAPEWLKKTINS